MTTKDLIVHIKEKLEDKGFEVEMNSNDYAFATKDGKSWREEVKGYSYTDFFGYTIGIRTVHRHNGTDENKSVDMEIVKWNRGFGRRIAKERLNVNFSEKQIDNRINKIVEQYNNL